MSSMHDGFLPSFMALRKGGLSFCSEQEILMLFFQPGNLICAKAAINIDSPSPCFPQGMGAIPTVLPPLSRSKKEREKKGSLWQVLMGLSIQALAVRVNRTPLPHFSQSVRPNKRPKHLVLSKTTTAKEDTHL